MLFNSIDFLLFLPVVFLGYWTFRKIQNLTILVSSYIFYGWWDWRFLFLIFFSSIVDYSIGLKISSAKKGKKFLLLTSIFLNIGLLITFKYYNFFASSFSEAFTILGNPISIKSIQIILPVGISFYTFQTLSYSIDVYRGNMRPTRDVVAFLSYVSFFPQLVAGPIERAKKLLPQFCNLRKFNYENAKDGLRQILWGLFKKAVIADNCAIIVDNIFSNYPEYSGSTLLVGAFFFSFQIYCDFSGYSDMAIGVAKLFNINLSKNFNLPYFSRNLAEFWRRWHISLSSWFKDYVYIPLGGSNTPRLIKLRNILVIFIISGIWHGANFTFIFWGILNFLLLVPLVLTGKNRKHNEIVASQKVLPNFREILNVGSTFLVIMMTWIFFRSASTKNAFEYFGIMFSKSIFSSLNIPIEKVVLNTFFIFILLLIEWTTRKFDHPLDKNINHISVPARWGMYILLVMVIILYGNFNEQEFIYFQF